MMLVIKRPLCIKLQFLPDSKQSLKIWKPETVHVMINVNAKNVFDVKIAGCHCSGVCDLN